MRSILAGLFLVPALLVAQIPRISVALSPAVVDSFVLRDPFSETYLPATVTSRGEKWDTVGIRYKGKSNRFFSKKPYRLKFPKDHLFSGRELLNLHAMYTDKSFLREKLAWDIFADMGELAPGASYVSLSINGTSQGLYLMVDKVDKRFLEARHRTVSSVYDAGGYYSLADMTVQSKELLQFYYPKAVGDKDEYDDLSELLSVINAAPDSLFEKVTENLFDMNSVYNWLAGNILMMMGDSYNKNYLLYRDSRRTIHQWVVIPWDYDQTFGVTGDPAVVYPQSLLNEGFSYSFPPLSGPSNILKDRLMQSPAMRDRLRRRVDTLLATVFTNEHLDPRIDSLAAFISTEVAADTQKPGTMQDFREQVAGLKYYITARRNYLFSTYVHEPSGVFGVTTLRNIPLNQPQYCVGRDGWQFATLWFSGMKGVDSIQVVAHPNMVVSGLDTTRCAVFARRWLQIIPYPATAKFTAALQWMYHDLSSKDTEIGGDHGKEGALRCYTGTGNQWRELPAEINRSANYIRVQSITDHDCGLSACFVLFAPSP
jgi:spore coat protein H